MCSQETKPRWGFLYSDGYPRVDSFLATLGFGTQSLWDCQTFVQNPICARFIFQRDPLLDNRSRLEYIKNMERWIVQLKGDRLDLQELPKWFPHGDIFAVEEDGTVFLTGPALNALQDAEAVLNCATQTLNNFAAVIFLLWNGFTKPTIRSVIHEDAAGTRSTFAFISGIASILFKASGVLVGGTASATTQAQDLLAAGRKSAKLREALTIWSDPIRSWPRLYRVMEEIEEHFGKPIDKAGLCSDSERVRFTRTANTAEVAGLDSRHASGKFQSPPDPLSLQEAESFLARILLAALRMSDCNESPAP